MKFRVKVGAHRENGIRFPSNTVVETDRDLVNDFGGEKFELVSSEGRKRVRNSDPDKTPDAPRLKPKHRGFGKWDVINGETGEAINDEPLNKEEASALAAEAAPEE